MKATRPETFFILFSLCFVFAWQLKNIGAQATPDYPALMAEKDEEIRNLKAALAYAKHKLAGTPTVLQEARTIDLTAVNRKKSIFKKINEKFNQKARQLKLQLKRIAAKLNEKRRQLHQKIKRMFGRDVKLPESFSRTQDNLVE